MGHDLCLYIYYMCLLINVLTKGSLINPFIYSKAQVIADKLNGLSPEERHRWLMTILSI